MRAVLVVSFGTTFEDTRVKNIEKLEKEIEKFSGCKVYRAWTSKKIIRRVLQRDGLQVDTVDEAMKRMQADGVTDMIVVPTHIINGIENNQMLCDLQQYQTFFHSLKVTDPLLTRHEDYVRVCEILGTECKQYLSEIGEDASDYAIVLMGHGSEHYANAAYAALDYCFKDMGWDNFFVGTVEAYPYVETVGKRLQKERYRKVLLTPFMLVAGDHAKNDMAGDAEDSWNTFFEREGYAVHCLVKGLGEYKSIRVIFVERVQKAMSNGENADKVDDAE